MKMTFSVLVIELLFTITQKKLLNLINESHQGITRTRLRAKLIFSWPGMVNGI